MDRLAAVIGIVLYAALSWLDLNREMQPTADGLWAPANPSLHAGEFACGLLNAIRPSTVVLPEPDEWLVMMRVKELGR
jgi:hypothetical protein